MNQYFNKRIATQSAKVLNLACILIHAFLLGYFWKLGVYLMVYVNVFSVLAYALIWALSEKLKVNVFFYIASYEIVVHMTLAAICVGAACAFHWVLICQPVLYFFVDYFSYELRGKSAHGALGSLISFCAFVFVEWYLNFFGTLYTIPNDVAFVTRQMIVLLIFIVSVFLLRLLTKYAYLTENNLRQKASVDALTGLYNRFDVLDEISISQQKGELEHAWIALMDIDDIKTINDTYGHGVGDHVLMQVAGVLRQNTQDKLCCRWGGDEFLICGRDETSEEEVISCLEKIRDEIGQLSFDMIDKEIQICVTMGLSFYQEGIGIQEWISTADKKLYAGKYTGKDRVMI